MTAQTARWHPDTCDCIIEFLWDDKDGPSAVLGGPAGDQPHVTIKVEPCERHKNIPEPVLYMTGPRRDNQNKNQLFAALADTTLGQVHLPEQEQQLNQDFSWEFAPDSTLKFSLLSRLLTSEEKSLIQSKLSSEQRGAIDFS